MSRDLVPLVIAGQVVARFYDVAEALDVAARLRERGFDATVPAACDGCGSRRRSVPVVTHDGEAVLCSRCYREREAERHGGAEPE